MEAIISIAVLGIIALLGIWINNQIITKKNQVKQAFGSIEIYLKKRFDLIPNLVAMLNKYLSHEKEILLKVTELRSRASNMTLPTEKIKASNELTQLMSGLSIHTENYPNLKSDTQFAKLQFELADIEDQISAARRAYNAAVTDFNNTIEKFPSSIIARMRNDETATLLEIPKAEQKEVNLNQLLNNPKN